MDFWTLCPKVGCVIGIMMDMEVQKLIMLAEENSIRDIDYEEDFQCLPVVK